MCRRGLCRAAEVAVPFYMFRAKGEPPMNVPPCKYAFILSCRGLLLNTTRRASYHCCALEEGPDLKARATYSYQSYKSVYVVGCYMFENMHLSVIHNMFLSDPTFCFQLQ